MSCAERMAAVQDRIAAACARSGRDPREVTILAVSKTRPAEAVIEGLSAGLTEFGENRVQELTDKASALAGRGVRWHMVGSVQTNKCRHLAGVEGLVMVQSLDRVRLADALEETFEKSGRPVAVCLQIDATGEASKHGCRPGDAVDLLRHVESSCPNLLVRGVMAMGPLDGDSEPVFEEVARIRVEFEQQVSRRLPVLSMGMTGDLEAAVAAGSTMVRVGTALFGPRR